MVCPAQGFLRSLLLPKLSLVILNGFPFFEFVHLPVLATSVRRLKFDLQTFFLLRPCLVHSLNFNFPMQTFCLLFLELEKNF